MDFSAASAIIRRRGKGTASMPFWQVLFPPPSLDSPALHSPGGRVPLGFTLNQDVVTGIYNVVLHGLLGDGRGLGHCKSTVISQGTCPWGTAEIKSFRSHPDKQASSGEQCPVLETQLLKQSCKKGHGVSRTKHKKKPFTFSSL